MKVKITRCSKDSYWYKGKVGEVFEVTRYDDENYILPDNVSLIKIGDSVQIVYEPAPQEAPKKIDAHYSFNYDITQDDDMRGHIKIDPYFVAKQWNLGVKDPSGVIWHIFKTCARFGEKNDKAREITAIYKSIKRLAELEGVTLE